MTNEITLKAFLIERGYTFYDAHSGQPDYIIGNYYRIDRTRNVPDCISNDKPPQFAIEETSMELNGEDWHRVSIGICNEAPQGWIDFKFYGLSPSDLIERLDELETALLKAWAGLFE